MKKFIITILIFVSYNLHAAGPYVCLDENRKQYTLAANTQIFDINNRNTSLQSLLEKNVQSIMLVTFKNQAKFYMTHERFDEYSSDPNIECYLRIRIKQ